MNKVGELDLRKQGLLTDTYFLFGNGAEGGVTVEPEAVFHGWRSARCECLPGGTQWSGSRVGAKCRSGWNQAFLTERQRRKKGLTALFNYELSVKENTVATMNGSVYFAINVCLSYVSKSLSSPRYASTLSLIAFFI